MMPINASETVACEVNETASIPELTEESTSAVTNTPATVKRRKSYKTTDTIVPFFIFYLVTW